MPWPKGRPSWNAGLTKKSDSRLQKQSDSMKLAIKDKPLRGCCSKEYLGSELHKQSSSKGGGFRENAGRGTKTKFSNILGQEFLLRSSYELQLAMVLNELNVIWEVPKSVLYEQDGKIKRYYPDFYVDELQLFIETKNNYLMSIQIDKFNCIKRVLPNLLILVDGDIPNLENIFTRLVQAVRTHD